MNYAIRKIALVLLFIAFLSAGCNRQQSPALIAPADILSAGKAWQLLVGGKTLNAQIASTPQEQAQGLSGRGSMADNEAMLFPFNPPSSPGFWMKDMKFSLDFIWIKNNKVISITPNVPAPKSSAEHLLIYYPPAPVDEALEVNAGWAKKNNIAVGDEVLLK